MAEETGRTTASAASSRRNSDSQPGASFTRPDTTRSQTSSVHFGTASQMSETSRQRRPPPKQSFSENYGSISASASASTPSREPGSSELIRPKKPGIGRRTTSIKLPRKGEEFSVDDDHLEVFQEREGERQRRKLASSTIRRQPPVRRRSTTTTQQPTLAKVDSVDDEDYVEESHAGAPTDAGEPTSPGEEETLQAEEEETPIEEDDLSDAESFTLKDRQEAINSTHPFGIRIWKPALYKKGRSVQKNAEEDIHSSPGFHVSAWLLLANLLWTILFGWWLALLCLTCAFAMLFCSCVSEEAFEYAIVLKGLGQYLFYPFGKFVKLIQDEAYAEEDEGEGRSISEYEQWQSGDLEEGRLFFGPVRTLIGRSRRSIDSLSETHSLLGRTGRGQHHSEAAQRAKRRLFGRGKWNFGRVAFYLLFYVFISPPLFLVSAICWLLVFSIPMGRVTLLLFDHLRRHPLALTFHADGHDVRHPDEGPSSILLCTYRAVGSRYWKYTIDGTNVFLINLLAIVAFTIFDFFVLDETLHHKSFITNQGFIFALALFSIIPLAYFIGQAVASISAQSSMGLGATINAFFSTVVEVFLYCVALKEGKAQLVEGSIIGSIFAGILFLPGLSMCFGALKRKTQRFNVKSAGVTSTMMLFAVIGAFGPTLFYQIYGSHELKCRQCHHHEIAASQMERDCRRCFFSQVPARHDRFYREAVLPYIWFSALMLFLSYLIGLLFTLHTHAAVIWSSDLDEKKASDTMESSHIITSVAAHDPRTLTRQNTAASTGALKGTDIRESQLYQRILGQSLKQVAAESAGVKTPAGDNQSIRVASIKSPHIVPPKSRDGEIPGFHLHGLSDLDNSTLTRQVAEFAATAAAVAARDATHAPRKALAMAATPSKHPHGGRNHTPHLVAPTGELATHEIAAVDHAGGAAVGGHDAPNWSRTKSAVILLTATIAYAIIAEILVKTVDTVLENVDIDEKFLGITLFALVPNTTEFLNAISFAMNGNIALSMEIGSAYALQVCLLQIPALVFYSAIWGQFINPQDVMDHTFTLIFPQWDMVTVILCVFLLSYMYGEGKSNYFKGSILILSYLVVVVGFWFSGFNAGEEDGIMPFDTLAFQGSPAFSAMKNQGFVMAG